MAQTVKGVIFDLDGTVLDTESFPLAVWPEVSRKRGYPASEELAGRLVGINEADEREILRVEFGAAYPYDEVRDEIDALFREKVERDGIAVKKGFGELLEHIKTLTLPYALATSTSRKIIGWKLTCAGLTDVFPLIVCGDEVENGKPAPDMFLKAARLMGQNPEDCIGIEDSPAGLRGLCGAGIRSVFIKDLITPSADVITDVWRECRNLGEVRPLLDVCTTDNSYR
ncbi:MAG: HAD family phosphatase [Spirochaetaceae bacterium]|jgi:beta-phosphoglucomutase-like phosphatase (HAD superfamily)|nr:HAD family phosphatase [Spirochaetaceae bacterium]